MSFTMASSGETLGGMNYVGLDVHRKSVVATVLDGEGRVVQQTKFGPTDRELVEFLEQLPGHRKVALEACSMWEHYYDAAASTGAEVTLSDPYKTKLIAKTNRKTDKVDSQALATLLRLDSLPSAFAPPSEIRALRSIVRERIFYRRKATSMMMRVYAQLVAKGIEYEDRILVHRRKREILRQHGLPLVDRGLDAIRAMEDTAKLLDQAIEEAWEASPEAQLLTTIPGVGKLTAVALVAFLCPIERFHSEDEVCSYVGLVPSTHQSGEHLYHGHLKRDSNGLLRTLLVEASWSHRQHCRSGAVSKIAKRVSRRGGRGKGSIAAAHKLLKIICAMLKRKEVFRAHAPGPSTAMQVLRRRKTTALRFVRRATLGPSTANSLSAS
jgi:transposase